MRLWITDLDNTLCDTDVLELDVTRIGELQLLPDVLSVFKVLIAQEIPIVVLTTGDFVYQRSKIHQLGLTDVVDSIYVAGVPEEKKVLFEKILAEYSTLPEDVVVIGDRRDSEVLIGKEAGASTIWFKHGKYNTEGGAPEGVHAVESHKEVLELIPEL
jgi:FMN phosphatase YigB (HAD superfamily)